MVDILTAEDKQAILNALETAKSLRVELSRAKRAGIDTTELEQRLAEAEAQLKRLKSVYI